MRRRERNTSCCTGRHSNGRVMDALLRPLLYSEAIATLWVYPARRTRTGRRGSSVYTGLMPTIASGTTTGRSIHYSTRLLSFLSPFSDRFPLVLASNVAAWHDGHGCGCWWYRQQQKRRDGYLAVTSAADVLNCCPFSILFCTSSSVHLFYSKHAN